MNKYFAWIIKAAVAGAAAFVLLCIWCSFYYNVPVHYTNETGATEYRWESGKFYRKGTEGFAFGRTNTDGFNNLLNYEEGMEIDILLLGSSHMEAFNVPQDESTAAFLNQGFQGEKYCYNIGTSGHTLIYCLKHLEAALESYGPSGYAVIETDSVSFSEKQLEQLVNGEVPEIPSHNDGLVVLLQRLPYLRLMYTKYLDGGGDAVPAGQAQAQPQENEARREELLNAALAEAGESCKNHGVRGIIVYSPMLRVDEEGRGYVNTKAEELERFKTACESSGLIFINMAEAYIQSYEQENKLPFGFANTEPGWGHMNSQGHRLFARAVEETIREMERK